MNKILAHVCKDKTYLPLLQELSSRVEIINGSLHEAIFDSYQKYKPNTVLLPIQEYTKEFHEFVDTFKTETQIIIFAGSLTDNIVMEYCDANKIKTICKDKTGDHILTYKYLYDSNLYYNFNMQKTDKILTILASNNEHNHKMLDDILYPKSMFKLVLINNPDFKHEQNIGSAQFNDLAVLMNHHSYAIDLTNSYDAELQACGVKTFLVDENTVAYNIENNKFSKTEDHIEQYSIKNFVDIQLLPFINQEEGR